jgi:hypothetical protein
MNSNSRRHFLRHAALTWGGLSLAGCGGGAQGSGSTGTQSGTSSSGSGGDSPPPAPAPAPAPTPAPAPAPAPAPTPAPAPAPIAPRTVNPAWIQGVALNTWVAIPGTVHAGSAAAPADNPLDLYASSNRRLSYSGMGLRNSELILAANGGHGDYAGNEVTSIDLSKDAPAWELRSAGSPTPASNVAYYADGKPSSRHTYWSTTWNAQRNRLMLHYSRFVYGTGTSFSNSNGFNLDTNTWDPKGTWSDGYTAGCADANGDVYSMGADYFGLRKWTAANDTWSTVATFPEAINVNPVCHDSTRGHLFALAWGDGQGNTLGGQSMSLSAIRIAGSTKSNITFNPSAALTQFLADKPAYSAMEYDPVNDQYLFYQGAAGSTSRVYVIKPNASTVWDMSILTLGAGSILPDAAVGAGVFNRFRYVAELRGFVLMSSGTSNLYFLRTA